MRKFYLGTHRPSWLWRDTPPLCIARQQLEGRKLSNLEPMEGTAMLDSGSFTELTKHGRQTWSALQYAELAHELHTRLGGFDWIAPQDWMCEPHMLARTGKTVLAHQNLTVENGLVLRSLAPHLPFRYVLQGGSIDSYLHCVDLYAKAGVDLTAEPLVGVGSVCRRQDTEEIADLFWVLWEAGLRNMHGFGVKTGGFRRYGRYLYRADSLAWSFRARKHGVPMPGCEGRGHANCANCLRFATHWYRERNAEFSAAVDEVAA